jgi:hypothetical protein
MLLRMWRKKRKLLHYWWECKLTQPLWKERVCRRDTPTGGITHTCIEISQGNSLSIYHYLKLAKMPCFSSSLFFFVFCKIREQKSRTGPVQGMGLAPVGEGTWWVKGVGEWIWYKKCVHMHVNAKMISAETFPWIRGRRIKGSHGRGEFKYYIVDIP